MYFGTMSQKLDDYEKYESEVWKPVFEREILRNNHRWWAVTKIVLISLIDLAYQNALCFVWRYSD